MNKKKELKYLVFNELENKVIKEQKQERKRHGNKRQEGETARQTEYKPHGSRNRERVRNRERNGNREEEREQAEEQRKQERRNYLDNYHGRSRAEDGKTNEERKNKLKIKTEIRNRKGKPR